MSHFHSKLQIQKTIDLIWNREVLLECRNDEDNQNEHVFLTRNVIRSAFIPKDNLQPFIQANAMIIIHEGVLMLDCGSNKMKKENTDMLFKKLSSIIHIGFKVPVKKKKYFTPKKREFY
ncbi:MAG TPA: hypothetical protein PK048_04240 [Candidatus Absconditabacterales bacterium]|nr:hypothetical protein [Candidatus Absconditabacterales bacterium]